MTYSSRLQAALDLVATTGIRESNYAPPMRRLLWRLGVNVPPPHFAGFLYNAAITGGWFAIAWGLVMWLAIWSKQGMSVHSAVGVAAVGGLLFGLAMAQYYRFGARKHRLPRWADIPPHVTEV